MAKNSFEYRNPDGTVRIMKVIERLPDGTRIFEDGSTALLSKCAIDGKYSRVADLSDKEYADWNEEILRKISEGLSEVYADI